MLVLSRMKGESVVINDNISVFVIEIRGDKVRLGFELPREMSLHRREVLDALGGLQVSQNQSTTTEPSPEDQRQIIQQLQQTIKDQREQIRSQEERIQQLIRGNTER